MRVMRSVVVLIILTLLSVITYSSQAYADEVKMVGTISKIELAAGNKSATIVLKDSKGGEEVGIIITDEVTLDKFKDKRIVEGDEIRCKFEKVDGKNYSKLFKKTAGC